VAKPFQQLIQFLYGPIFKIIGFFYRAYTTNRARIEHLKSQQKIAAFIRNGAVFILVVWIFIWYFGPGDSGEQLAEEVKESIGSRKSLSE